MESIRQLISQTGVRGRGLDWVCKVDYTFGCRVEAVKVSIPRLLVLKPPHDSPESVLLAESFEYLRQNCIVAPKIRTVA